MTRYLPLVLGLAVALVCGRLGLWQLDRLGQRRAQNAVLEGRLALRSLDLSTDRRSGGLADVAPESLHFRRASATGRFDFGRETVEIARTRRGAPGVHVVTPLVLADGSGVLVVRGWAYSADSRTVDLTALAEPETTTVAGMLAVPPRSLRSVHPDSVSAPYVLLGAVLRRLDPPDSLPPGLVVLDAPVLNEGSHRSYAFQWFSFAVIALVGSVVLVVRTTAGRR